MSAIYIDQVENQVTIPNTTLGVEVERRLYNTRTSTKVRNRLYNNTYLSNVIYCPYGCTNVGKGTVTSTKKYSCSTCPSTCKSRGWTYVSCVNNGAQCRCETGVSVQKCNLSGAICKANNPRAASCTVQTFTNGGCSCNCKTATGQALGPAPKPGSVASESKPVSSTPLKPGVIPSPGGLGSPEAEGIGTTRPLSTNTKFGSYDIATLRAQPPGTYSGAVALAAANRQYDALVLLQTAEGHSYYDQLGHVQRLAQNLYNEFKAGKISEAELTRRYRQDIVPTAVKTLELGTKWRKAYYGASYAKSPGGYASQSHEDCCRKRGRKQCQSGTKDSWTRRWAWHLYWW